MTDENPTELSRCFQVAYVTNDMERATEVFHERYGVPRFHVIEDVRIEARTPHGPHPMHFHLAAAWLGETMFELIEPIDGAVQHYRDFLPPNRFATAFHHLAFEVGGSHEDWLVFRAALLRRHGTFVFEGPEDFPLQFLYVDNCASLGHYHEYVWYGANGRAIWADVPRY